MIQRADAALILGLGEALGIGNGERITAISLLASTDPSLSLITGWDSNPEGAALKVYVNASDAAMAVRARAASKLGLAKLLADKVPAPHIIGFNFSKTGFEVKAYVQSNDAEAAATPLGSDAVTLAREFASVSAGAVVSWDLGPTGFEPRAFFVGTTSQSDAAWALCRELPGWNDDAVNQALPFTPGPLRSVGISLRRPSWTAYFRAQGDTQEPLAQLSPSLCLRSGSSEIGLFVEPLESGTPAAVRTEHHVLSYRVRQGSIAGEQMDAVLRWAIDRVAQSERASIPLRSAWGTPPRPWVIVAD